MPLRLNWCGFDFGETIMNPFTLHQSTIIHDVYKQLGREEEAESKVQKWYRLRDSFGSPGDPPQQRVRLLKQYAKERVYSEVLDDDREAARLFDEKEARGFAPTEGIAELLDRLRGKAVTLGVVSESASLPATRAIESFLATHSLASYFHEIITPAGLFTVAGELIDRRFIGTTKKSGVIYDTLKSYLKEHGTESGEAAMVGDDPVLDIEYPRLRGFITIQYVGVVDRGHSSIADYLVDDWREFPEVE